VLSENVKRFAGVSFGAMYSFHFAMEIVRKFPKKEEVMDNFVI